MIRFYSYYILHWSYAKYVFASEMSTNHNLINKENDKVTNKLLTSAICAVLATAGFTHAMAETQATENKQITDQNMMKSLKGMERCYGIAKVGQNDCGTASHMCAGESTIDNDKEAWISVPNGLCNRIVGGSAQSQAQKS